VAAAEREAEDGEQLHAVVLEGREDSLALTGSDRNGHVVVLDASHGVGHRLCSVNDTPASHCPESFAPIGPLQELGHTEV
jgi:hypothetical protein